MSTRTVGTLRSISETVGAKVKAFRHARGLTVKQFVEECAGIGWRTTTDAINNIEGARRIRDDGLSPRREISVDELLMLARVFGVAPVDLLVPEEAQPDDVVTLPLGLQTTAGRYRQWIGGKGLLYAQPSDLAGFVEAVRRLPQHRVRELIAEAGYSLGTDGTPASPEEGG